MYILEPYDDLLLDILKNGQKRQDRTGVGTLAIFGAQRRYNISEHFPLLTKRKINPKAVFAELLWFLSGSTLNHDLQNLGTEIWTPWVDTAFEVKHGYTKSALGPIYGFALRYFDGDYGNGDPNNWECKSGFADPEYVYGRGGFDQLAYIMEEIKTNPSSRRILFNLWNPKTLDKVRLPPCHYSFQLFINDGKMSGMLTQRSCDVPIGVPFNIAFYSALIYMLAQQTGYEPYEFVHTMADTHIYLNQIEAVEEYLVRSAGDSPKLLLNKADDIYSYKMEDFVLSDYFPQPVIKIPVAV